MTISTRPASGTRDFLPDAIAARRAVVAVIQDTYERYGFAPIETPAMERLEVLTGKYGDEGDQLIFKVLKRGEKLELGPSTTVTDLADLALRYDLTVPLARVVAAHQASLPRYFKRYQIQTVWRADRPQRGRFREFFQCDVDYTGTTSLAAEATVVTAVADALGRLGFRDFAIRLNDRRILTGLMEVAGVEGSRQAAVLVAIDKLDKVGVAGVEEELRAAGLTVAQVDALRACLPTEGVGDRLGALAALFDGRSSAGSAGVATLQGLLSLLQAAPLPAGEIVFDPSLARGLSYYTGPIFEIQVADLAGSLGGGGRYDQLVGMFRGAEVPAVGFSLGLERILVVMEERGMLAPPAAAVDVLVAVADAGVLGDALAFAARLRGAAIRTDVYPEATKVGKQIAHAESIGARIVVIIGRREVDAGVVTVKELATGRQQTALVATAIDDIAAALAAGRRPAQGG